jgi:hypothetical protein
MYHRVVPHRSGRLGLQEMRHQQRVKIPLPALSKIPLPRRQSTVAIDV